VSLHLCQGDWIFQQRNVYKSGLGERKPQKEETVRVEPIVQKCSYRFCTCTLVAMDTVTYAHELQWAHLHMYVGSSKVNHTHPYQVF
jgi:hypothetical protein